MDRLGGTYFARMFSETEGGEPYPFVHRGVMERIDDPCEVLEAVRDYARIPEGIVEYLLHDWQRRDQNTPICW